MEKILITYATRTGSRAFLVCMTLAMKKGEEYRPVVSGWLDPVPISEGFNA